MSIFKYKAFNERKDKILLSVTAIAISIYMAFSCTYFTASAGTVKEDVVRLHILANSNSEIDQEVKLKVRDALLETNASILSDSVTKENAKEHFESSKEILLKTAKKTLKENGFNYNVKITLQEEYFNTRTYGNLTFPAGQYTALKVVLGNGEGKNWWCVMFPPLCVPAADGLETNETTADYLTKSGEKIVNGGEKYIIKFKFLEIYEEFRNKLGTKVASFGTCGRHYKKLIKAYLFYVFIHLRYLAWKKFLFAKLYNVWKQRFPKTFHLPFATYNLKEIVL